MKKSKMLYLSLIVTILSGCSAIAKDNQSMPIQAKVNIANPASVYCVKQGGKLEIRKDSNGGEKGYCHLPDGRVVEEWKFFRANSIHKKE
ncbi:MAG: putative hemolysin [Commensalibacter sp.]